MQFLISITVIVFFVTVPLVVASDCPFGTFSSADSKVCYFPVALSANFSDAEQFCARLFEGGHLASIHNATDDALIYAKMPPVGAYWIGGYKAPYDTFTFVWIDGSAFNYAKWGDYDSGDCILAGTLWNRSDCSLQVPFVCQVKSSYRSII